MSDDEFNEYLQKRGIPKELVSKFERVLKEGLLDKSIELSSRNRDKRLKSSIGEEVILRFGNWHLGYKYCIAILKEYTGEKYDKEYYVLVEIDNQEIKIQPHWVKYVEIGKKKEKKERKPIDPPKTELEFKMTDNTYMIEEYVSKALYIKGRPYRYSAQIRYGTTVRTWYVNFDISYKGDRDNYAYGTFGYGTSGIKSRKEARRLLFEYIENAHEGTLEKWIKKDDYWKFVKKNILAGVVQDG